MAHQMTRLVGAVRAGDVARVRAVLAEGASVDDRDDGGRTALMWACTEGHIEIAQVILEAGASPNRRTADREETALHLLARRPDALPAIELLLRREPRLDRRDGFGWTPLMVAAQSGHADVVKALLAAGADPDALTPDGRTARDLAVEADHPAVLSVLGHG